MPRIDRREYTAYQDLAQTRLRKGLPPLNLPKPAQNNVVGVLIGILIGVIAASAIVAALARAG